MNSFKFDRDAYLQRLDYSGESIPTADTLNVLHRSHLYRLPFENFDIQLGRGIDLAPEVVFNKLVHNKRGGYCFELNGLFLLVLKTFGFDARALLARVQITGTPTGRGHQIEPITIQGRQWIADVGFGADTPRTPIPLELNKPAAHDGQTVRLVGSEYFGIMLQALKNDQWMDLYSFDLNHVLPVDIDYENHFTATHPTSLFVLARVAALPIQNGAITLFNNTLTKSIDGESRGQELAEGQAYIDALKTHFGIELDAPYEKLRPLPEMDFEDNR